MTRQSLHRLLNPRHIAFVGGRALEGAIGNCEALGYPGEVWVANPAYETLAGRPCFPSIAALPAAPDAAFVALRRDRTVEVVRELASRGAGVCVCYAAGFAEVGDTALQAELVAAAGDMALLGPNCYGVLNYLDGVALWPDLHGGERVTSGVALISQSGNLSLNATMADRSLPLSYVISVGNQAGLGVGDCVDALVEDRRVTAIGLYVEGLHDLPGFGRAALRAAQRGVPLVALKVGTSRAAVEIARSHTGSNSEPDDHYRALLERCAVPRVDSLAALLEALKAVSAWGARSGPALGVLAASGGDAALFADLAARTTLAFPPFDATTTADLHAQLGELVTVSNPLDYNTGVWGRRAELERCFATVLGGAFDAVVLTIDYPRPGTGDPDPWDAALDALVAARSQTDRCTAVVSTLPEGLPHGARERLLAGGIVPLQGLAEAVAALDAAARYAQRHAAIAAGPVPTSGEA